MKRINWDRSVVTKTKHLYDTNANEVSVTVDFYPEKESKVKHALTIRCRNDVIIPNKKFLAELVHVLLEIGDSLED